MAKLKITKKQLLNLIDEELTLFTKEKQEEEKQEPIAKQFSSVFIEALELTDLGKKKEIYNEVYNFLKKYSLKEGFKSDDEIDREDDEIRLKGEPGEDEAFEKFTKRVKDKDRPPDNVAEAYVKAFGQKNGYNWEQFQAKESKLHPLATVVYFMTAKGYNYMEVFYVFPGQHGYDDPMSAKTTRPDGARLYGEW